MSKLNWLIWLLIALASLAMVVGYAQGGIWLGGAIAFVMGLAWIASFRLDIAWISSAGLAMMLGLEIAGIWMGINPYWSLFSCLAALGAWDLESFLQRQSIVSENPHALRMERAHLSRLAIAILFGAVLAVVALLVQARFNFTLASVLGMLALFGLSRLIAHLRSDEN